MRYVALTVLLVVAACSSSETATTAPADGGTTDPPASDSGTQDSSIGSPDSGGTTASDAGDAAKDGGTSAAAGSCVAPKTIALPFSETAGSTAVALDSTSVACGAPASLSEAVYRLVLANDAAVKVTANDESGQGIGVQVRETSCTGTSVECTWQANGDYTKTLPLPAGTWFFVVERSPEGEFSFEIEEQ